MLRRTPRPCAVISESGTPQGGIISPALANLTLDGLERLLRERFKASPGPRGRNLWHNPRVHLIRYADDFIITGRSREQLETEVRPLVEAFLRERGPTLSPEETKITHVSEGFNFLGQHVRKHGDCLLIVPAKKNMHAFMERVRMALRKNVASAQEPLIRHVRRFLRSRSKSAEQASMLGRDGENVTCPTCHMIMKVIVCASRKDLYAFPVVTLQTHGVVETVR